MIGERETYLGRFTDSGSLWLGAIGVDHPEGRASLNESPGAPIPRLRSRSIRPLKEARPLAHMFGGVSKASSELPELRQRKTDSRTSIGINVWQI